MSLAVLIEGRKPRGLAPDERTQLRGGLEAVEARLPTLTPAAPGR